MAVTHERLRHIRDLVDGYPDDRVVVGEVFLLSSAAVATYYGNGDELHLSFNFPPLYARWEALKWRRCIENTTSAFDPRARGRHGCCPTTTTRATGHVTT